MDKWTGKRVMLGAAMLAASLALCIGGRSAVQAVMHHDSARTLVIDAGHGGFDGGAVGSNGTTEQDINLSIAQRVQSLAAFFGVRTAMTRTDENALDYDPSRPVRENKIADIKARRRAVSRGTGVLFAESCGQQNAGRAFAGQPCRWLRSCKHPAGQAGGKHDLSDESAGVPGCDRRMRLSVQPGGRTAAE